MSEEKTINDQKLEKAAGGIGVPGGPQLSYSVMRYRCPNCGRELARSSAPTCPKCGVQMIKGSARN